MLQQQRPLCTQSFLPCERFLLGANLFPTEGPTDRPPCLSDCACWMHACVRLGSDRVSKAGAIPGLEHVDTSKASKFSKKLSVLTGYLPDNRAITKRKI